MGRITAYVISISLILTLTIPPAEIQTCQISAVSQVENNPSFPAQIHLFPDSNNPFPPVKLIIVAAETNHSRLSNESLS